MTIEHPGKNNQPRDNGWEWGEDDRELATYESGEETYKVIIGEHEYYGQGVFTLKNDGTIWVLDEILGRPTEILGYKLQDEQ